MRRRKKSDEEVDGSSQNRVKCRSGLKYGLRNQDVEIVDVNVKENRFSALEAPIVIDDESVADRDLVTLNVLRQVMINEADVECLKKNRGQESWLNDNIIMKYLTTELPKINENTLIIESMVWKSDFRMPRTMRNLAYPEYKEDWEYLVFPINIDNSHWVLAIVDSFLNLDFFDTTGSEITEEQKLLIEYVIRGINGLDSEERLFVCYNNVENNSYFRQQDGYSCGPAICMLAERFLKRENLLFNEIDVRNWRINTLEILREQLRTLDNLFGEENNNQANLVAEEVENQEIEENNAADKNSSKNLRKRKRKSVTGRRRIENSEKNRKKVCRDKKTVEEKEMRNKKDAENKKRKRDQETVEEKDKRNKKDAERHKDKRKKKKAKTKETYGDIAKIEFQNEKELDECFDILDIGDMTDKCEECGALFFKNQMNKSRNKESGKMAFDKCCKNGKVKLDWPFKDYPKDLYDIVVGNSYLSKKFFKAERSVNCSVAFGSHTVDHQEKETLPFAYKIQGQVYHKINQALHPDSGLDKDREYGQLFFVETEQAVDTRLKNKANEKCDRELMIKIDQILKQCNPYYQSFKMMIEVENEGKRLAEIEGREPGRVKLVFNINNSVDKRRYNLPARDQNELAAVFVLKDGEEVPMTRGITVHQQGRQMRQLTKWDKREESLIYPVFFPTGKGGVHKKEVSHPDAINKVYKNIADGEDGDDQEVTFSAYYRYLIARRMTSALVLREDLEDNSKFSHYDWAEVPTDFEWFCPLRLGKMLYQQYIVDAYVKIEQDKLDFHRKNQEGLKVENYKALHEYLEQTADETGKKVGKVIILPSTFKNGPRQIQQSYQDIMSTVRRYGKPDLFITFTCNPKWVEIQRNLLKGNNEKDEFDLICDVFKLKVDELIDDIVKREIFGGVIAWNYVIEFQKRGLPHAHILVILDKDSKIRTAEDVDKIICAELPDKDECPRLFETVTRCMIHGPCGELNKNSACMSVDNDGKDYCTKRFPKEFQEKTVLGNDSYPVYRRRDDGRTFEKNGVTIDNRWVVPYNKFLSLKYDAHINVEICSTIKSVKYLYKYCYKGHDAARMVLKKTVPKKVSGKSNETVEHDEIQQYLDMRWVTPHEGYWRIMEYHLEERSHAVYTLDVHLEEEQNVIFKKGEKISEKLEKSSVKETHLTAWFNLNRENKAFRDGSYPRNLYFYELPERCVFEKNTATGNMEWREMKPVAWKPCIGRMWTMNPKVGELFYLRQLLLNRKGAISFEDLRTVEVDGEIKECRTFREACAEMGLLDKGDMWIKYFAEVVATNPVTKQLRELLVTLMYHGENVDFFKLWEEYKEELSDDFVRKGSSSERAQELAKADIQRQLEIADMTLEKFGISLPVDVDDSDLDEVDKVKEFETFTKMYGKMYQEQKNLVDFVERKLEEQRNGTLNNGCVVIYGPGGCGKTFIYEALCRKFRAEGIKFKTSAWMSIAANLLPDGRTLHKNFGLPFNLDKHSVSNIKPNSKAGRELIETQVIIIDEISMVPKYALEILDKKLKELMDNSLPFGGKIVLIGGDFRQILPIEKGGRSVLVSLSIVKSRLWDYFGQHVFTLTENRRVDKNEKDFKEFLLKLGNRELPCDEEEFVEIPDHCIIKSRGNGEADLIDEVFGDIMGDYKEMAKRVILTTKNDKASKFNAKILERLDNEKIKSYFSRDTFDKNEPHAGKAIEYSEEFLNSINEGGLPPHELKLIENCVVILLRNLNPAAGLCNGTRLIVKRMHKRFLECEYLLGAKKGERVLIPKITLSNSKKIGFVLHRHQFPVKLCYAMTINRSQGQTIDFVGLDLVEPVFGHGMTYVAFSRCRGWKNIRVQVDPARGNKVKNVVWKEALLENANSRVEPMEIRDIVDGIIQEIMEIIEDDVKYNLEIELIEVDVENRRRELLEDDLFRELLDGGDELFNLEVEEELSRAENEEEIEDYNEYSPEL